MEKDKLIVIEGTDCSGKETQSNLLREKLVNDGLHVSELCAKVRSLVRK